MPAGNREGYSPLSLCGLGSGAGASAERERAFASSLRFLRLARSSASSLAARLFAAIFSFVFAHRGAPAADARSRNAA